ncbi:MAG: 1-deoxy-D-xylulose-5-phosphate reductoisomerase [Thermodesulfobacteriota bacterium]
MDSSNTAVKHLALLGSTGSIGRNVLDIVRRFPGRYRICGLAAGRNVALLKEQIEAFNPRLVAVADEEDARGLRESLPAFWGERIVGGGEGAARVATLAEADMVISAIVGAAGLTPTLAAVEAGKNIGLANKETLVMAGELVMETARRTGATILPVDSEHNAIFQALAAGRRQDIKKVILTASGGPFNGQDQRTLWSITPEQALAHPNWSMGRKISIDSATLINKGLELIEARWLFDLPLEMLEILIHPQSIVHSMVEFVDGSVVAQMGIPDMRIPIAYALSYPERLKINLPPLNLAGTPPLSFQRPDFDRIPALKLAYQACSRGGTIPAAFNAANEIAVAAFLDRRIRFPEIVYAVAETVNRCEWRPAADLATVMAADMAARLQAESIITALELAAGQKMARRTTPSTTAATAANRIPDQP